MITQSDINVGLEQLTNDLGDQGKFKIVEYFKKKSRKDRSNITYLVLMTDVRPKRHLVAIVYKGDETDSLTSKKDEPNAFYLPYGGEYIKVKEGQVREFLRRAMRR